MRKYPWVESHMRSGALILFGLQPTLVIDKVQSCYWYLRAASSQLSDRHMILDKSKESFSNESFHIYSTQNLN